MVLLWRVQRPVNQLRGSLAVPSRNPRVAVVVGRLVGSAFLIRFATGIYRHFIQEPAD